MQTNIKPKPLPNSSSRIYFRRYTSVASVLHVLVKNEITLLSPEKWDDQNDRVCMEEYKRRMSAETVLALCLTEATETYHHWKTFTNGEDGACIYFHRRPFEEAIGKQASVRFEKVNYRKLNETELFVCKENLPFLKFPAYAAEKEWRIVFHGCEDNKMKSIPVPRECFYKISLNPWMPLALVNTVSDVVRKISGFEDLPVDASKIRKNEKWLADVLKP